MSTQPPLPNNEYLRHELFDRISCIDDRISMDLCLHGSLDGILLSGIEGPCFNEEDRAYIRRQFAKASKALNKAYARVAKVHLPE